MVGTQGTMVPWYPSTMVHSPYPPRWQYTRVPYTSFSGFWALSVGRHRSVSRVNVRKTRLFRVPIRVLLCQQGTRPGIRSRIPGFLDPSPNKTESISVTFVRTAGPRKQSLSGQKLIRTTQ